MRAKAGISVAEANAPPRPATDPDTAWAIAGEKDPARTSGETATAYSTIRRAAKSAEPSVAAAAQAGRSCVVPVTTPPSTTAPAMSQVAGTGRADCAGGPIQNQ